MSDEAQKMGIEILQSDYKNLIRKISNRFEELKFVQKSPNNVLVYPSTIKIEDLVSENHDLQSELNPNLYGPPGSCLLQLKNG